MIPANFNYHKATSLSEAIALSQQLGEEAKYMSGGHSLLPMMKLRFARPEHIIDISKIHGLSYIKEDGDLLKIGAMTTQTELEHNDLLKSKYKIFGDAVWLTADPSVRNFGTIGGNIAHGDAANDQPALMLALREIQIPKAKKNSGGAYHKVERKVGDYATAGVAVHVVLDDNGVCQEIGIGLTNVSAVPLRLERGENLLRGKKITDELIEQVGVIAGEDCEPESDLRGSEAYKRSIVNTITKRMLNKALERAKK